MDGCYVLTSKTTKKTDLCIFCQKVKKRKNFSSTSTERKNLMMDENYMMDYWKVCDLSVIQYHSNGCYKPYTLQAQRELENRKRKKHRTENNEAEISVLVEQDRRSKRQKSKDNRSNKCIICGNKTFRKNSKLYRLWETERTELFWRATKFNMDAVFTSFQSLINLMNYLQLILWVTSSAWTDI